MRFIIPRVGSIEFKRAHEQSDVDSGPFALHHTLGTKAEQASRGNHVHDGKDSKLLLEGFVVTGAKSGNTALASVIAALVKLGATDTTT